jgi:hypothetical protein
LLLLQRLSAWSSFTLLETDESRYYLPSEDWLVPLSLGFREAFAGLVWVRLLTYFGEQHEVHGGFDHLERYIFATLRLDPYFYRAYTFGSMAVIYNGTLINRNAVDFSIDVLEEGVRYFPNDGNLHYYLGFQYYFELAMLTEGVERQRLRRIGMDEICTAAILGGGPPHLPLLCSSLAERQGMEHLAMERLSQTLLETEDPRTRIQIEDRLEIMMTDEAAYDLMRHINDFRLRWRQDMPYAPAAFYLLAGPKGVMPSEDQVRLPLPMDTMIQAEFEELFQIDGHTSELAPNGTINLGNLQGHHLTDEGVTIDSAIEVDHEVSSQNEPEFESENVSAHTQ